MDPRRTRRQVLALVASGSLVGSAGCLGNSSEAGAADTDDGARTTTPTPEQTVPDVDCNPADYPSLSSEIPDGAWTPTRGNQRRTGANHDMRPLDLEDVDELQATEMFSDSSVDFPAVTDGTIYVDNGETYALDVETGESEWSRYTQAVKTPVVTEDTVYLSAGGAQVHAIDRREGVFRWTTQLDNGRTIQTAPLVADGNVIVGHVDGGAENTPGWYTAMDRQCGSKQWSFGYENAYPIGHATNGSTVYAATAHHLYAVAATDGTEHWQVRVTDSTLERPPALAGETVLLSDGGTLYALAATDGSERWNTRDRFTVKHPPTVSSDAVYVVESETNDVLALDMETGQELWRYSGVPGEINSALTEVSGILYAAGDLEREPFRFGILGLDVSTGTKQADATLQSLDRANARTISELAMTPAGVITHAGTTEGGNPELIYRIRPD